MTSKCCAVPLCGHDPRKHEYVTMHRIPDAGPLRDAWLAACQLTDSAKQAKVCGKHFDRNAYGCNKKKLVSSAVPSKNLPGDQPGDPEDDDEGAGDQPGDPEDDDEGAGDQPADPEDDDEGAGDQPGDPEDDDEGAGDQPADPEDDEGAGDQPADPEDDEGAGEPESPLGGGSYQQLSISDDIVLAAADTAVVTSPAAAACDGSSFTENSRPPVTKKRKMSTEASNERRVYLPRDTWQRLSEFAASKDMTPAAAVRSLIDMVAPECDVSTMATSAPASHNTVATPQFTFASPSSTLTIEPANNADPWTPSRFPESNDEYFSEDEEAVNDQNNEANQEAEEHQPSPPDGCWSKGGAMVCTDQLMELLNLSRVQCDCGQPALPSVAKKSIAFSVTWTCPVCSTVQRRWRSSPRTGKIDELDVIFAGAIVLSGNHYEKIRSLFHMMNFGIMAPATYHRAVESSIIPTVTDHYQTTIQNNIRCAQAASPDGLVLAGDCQNDSPGFSAAYGTYTIMDVTTEKIVAQAVVSRQEVRFSSPQLEVEGARRCLDQLGDAGCNIKEFVAGQHLGVKKMVCDKIPGVIYSYDTWHAAKILSADMRKAASDARAKGLMPWISHVKNHFWWCVEHCAGSVDRLQRDLEMTLHHVCGVHETVLNKCHHDATEPDDHPPYLEKDSAAHHALREVLLSDKLRRKLPFLVRYRHTGKLESFHATTLAYTPKRVFFGPPMFAARKRVAVLDHSANCHRPVLLGPDGSERCTTAYSRAQAKFILKPIRAPKTFPYVKAMLEEMVSRKGRREERRVETQPTLHPYVHPGRKPTREERGKMVMDRDRLRRFR